MAASRLLAPYFGTSQLVWANLIGLILIGLSLGYAYGGRLADRRPEPRLLYGLVLAAGVYQALIPLLARPVLSAMLGGWFGTPVTVIAASFAAILLIFLPPVVILAMVSPFTIRLATKDVAESGRVAGGLYAASTLGSIAGTFVPAFLTIPFLGTKETIFLFAALQIAVAAWRLGRPLHALWLLVPAAAAALTPGVVKPVAGLLFEDDTLYQYVQVVEEGGERLLVINEGGGIQSVYDPHHLLTGLYTDSFAVLPFLARPAGPRPERALVIGSAGGTLFRIWDRLVRPRLPMEMWGVEIDPVVASLGPRYFGLRGDEARVVVADGRVALARFREPFDLVVVDAYANQLYIPFQLSTREFFAEVRRRLAPQGLLALNVNATGDDAPLLLAFERTVADVFPYTYVAKVRGPLNYMVLGAARPLDLRPLEELRGSGDLAPLAAELQAALRPADGSGGILLTDDRAPVEYLTNAMVLSAVRRSIR
ncbi:MAG: fused MFS/spermidine synthase [Firmicutes bacterium]|nr:fused MFS/spermidine synthase [Bacillota bacterium]